MPRRRPHLAYRALALSTAGVCMLLGTLFVVAFLDRTLFQLLARPLFETDHWGYYILGFAGATLVAWGGCLTAAARRPVGSGGIAAGTAAGLLLGAILRLLAWYSGEYRLAGDQLRLEAAIMTLLALGFVWLRPEGGGPGES